LAIFQLPGQIDFHKEDSKSDIMMAFY